MDEDTPVPDIVAYVLAEADALGLDARAAVARAIQGALGIPLPPWDTQVAWVRARYLKAADAATAVAAAWLAEE